MKSTTHITFGSLYREVICRPSAMSLISTPLYPAPMPCSCYRRNRRGNWGGRGRRPPCLICRTRSSTWRWPARSRWGWRWGGRGARRRPGWAAGWGAGTRSCSGGRWRRRGPGRTPQPWASSGCPYSSPVGGTSPSAAGTAEGNSHKPAEQNITLINYL